MGLTVKAIGGVEEGQVVGYYGEKRRRDGETFKIRKAKDFSHRWMEAIGWEPPPPRDIDLVPFEERLVNLDMAAQAAKDAEVEGEDEDEEPQSDEEIEEEIEEEIKKIDKPKNKKKKPNQLNVE